MHANKDKRIVGDIKMAVYGKVSQEQKFVPTTATKLTGGWVKVTPSGDLEPGEYAVVELLGKEGMNLYVWDFGVNPSAGPNATAWKPDASATQPTSRQAKRIAEEVAGPWPCAQEGVMKHIACSTCASALQSMGFVAPASRRLSCGPPRPQSDEEHAKVFQAMKETSDIRL